MNILSLIARIMGKHGAKTKAERDRQRIRDRTDQMRRDMGMKPIRWGR